MAEDAGIPTTEEIFEFVEDLVKFGARRTGTDAGRAAAEYVADSFRSFGIDEVHVDTVDSTRWDADAWDLHVGGQSYACHPVNHSGCADGVLGPFGTGPDGLTRRLVDLATAGPDTDVRDAIVMFDVRFGATNFEDLAAQALSDEQRQRSRIDEVAAALPDAALVDPYNTTLAAEVWRAAANGAVGFVAVLADYFESNRYANEDYGDLTIPGVWVTRKEAGRIREQLPVGDGVAKLRLEGAVHRVVAHSPVAVLPGRTSDTILIHSHHDSVGDGAVEDASGTAEVLALAKYFASLPPGEREKTLMFATMDTHFTGYEAHEAFVEKYVSTQWNGRTIVLDLVVEHIALAAHIEDGDLVVDREPSPRVMFTNAGRAAVDIICAELAALPLVAVLPADVLPGDELPTDGDYTYRAGVPVASFIAAPIYLYDQADTLDKVDRDQLRPVATCLARMVRRIDALPAHDIIS